MPRPGQRGALSISPAIPRAGIGRTEVHHLTGAAADGPLPDEKVRAIVHRAVHDARQHQEPLPPAQSVNPWVTEARQAVQAFLDAAAKAGHLYLKIAPAYLSEDQAADLLADLSEEISEELPTVLAQRRYALTGDRRALEGTVL